SQVAPFAALHQRRRKRRAGLFSTWFSLQPSFAILVTLSSLRGVPDSCQFPIGLRAPTRAGGLGGSCRMREEITAGVFVATGLADAERAPNLEAVTLPLFRVVGFIPTKSNESFRSEARERRVFTRCITILNHSRHRAI